MKAISKRMRTQAMTAHAGKKIIEVGCWGTARCKFFDAKTSDAVRAHAAMAMIQRLYKVEKDAKDLDDAVREGSPGAVEADPEGDPRLVDAGEGSGVAQEPDRRSDRICLESLAGIGCYTEVGWLSIDNNASERGMKPARSDARIGYSPAATPVVRPLPL